MHFFSLVETFVVPELLTFLLHALQELVLRDVPVHIVGVRNEHADNGERVVAQFPTFFLIGEGAIQLHTVKHQLIAQIASEPVECTY